MIEIDVKLIGDVRRFGRKKVRPYTHTGLCTKLFFSLTLTIHELLFEGICSYGFYRE